MSNVARSAFAQRRAQRAGFTLVELLVTVAMVGVLSVMAIYGIRRWTAHARTAQVRDLLEMIAQGQAAYYADTEGYLSCSGSYDPLQMYPMRPNDKKHEFHNPSHTAYDCFKLLAARANDPTYASFAVLAGTASEPVAAPPLSGFDVSKLSPGLNPTPWYTALAAVDQDADKVYGYFFISSFAPGDVLVENPDE